ncbi:hypothetical protein LH53_04040 [Mesotoga sp. TolDC]|nr:hypothetical protein LH53_04040 [Mesotoga sp. TolDC]
MYVVVLIKEENKNGAYFLLRPRGHPNAEILYHHGLLEFNSKFIVKSEMLKRVQTKSDTFGDQSAVISVATFLISLTLSSQIYFGIQVSILSKDGSMIWERQRGLLFTTLSHQRLPISGSFSAQRVLRS